MLQRCSSLKASGGERESIIKRKKRKKKELLREREDGGKSDVCTCWYDGGGDDDHHHPSNPKHILSQSPPPPPPPSQKNPLCFFHFTSLLSLFDSLSWCFSSSQSFLLYLGNLKTSKSFFWGWWGEEKGGRERWLTSVGAGRPSSAEWKEHAALLHRQTLPIPSLEPVSSTTQVCLLFCSSSISDMAFSLILWCAFRHPLATSVRFVLKMRVWRFVLVFLMWVLYKVAFLIEFFLWNDYRLDFADMGLCALAFFGRILSVEWDFGLVFSEMGFIPSCFLGRSFLVEWF